MQFMLHFCSNHHYKPPHYFPSAAINVRAYVTCGCCVCRALLRISCLGAYVMSWCICRTFVRMSCVRTYVCAYFVRILCVCRALVNMSCVHAYVVHLCVCRAFVHISINQSLLRMYTHQSKVLTFFSHS